MSQMARKKSSLKAICDLAYGLLGPNILVLYVCQKKREKKKRIKGRKWGSVFKYIKQGVIFSNESHFKKEDIYEKEAVSWTSQQLNPGLIPRAVTKL